jgi:hypothetical protein
MKYGAISVKYISYFSKINMKYNYESGQTQKGAKNRGIDKRLTLIFCQNVSYFHGISAIDGSI